MSLKQINYRSHFVTTEKMRYNMKQYNLEDMEINIKDWFCTVCLKWRSIIVMMLLFAILAGGYSYIKPQMEKNIAYTDSAWTADSLAMMSEEVEVPIELLPDSLVPKKRARRDWATWKPNAKKAMWLALVIPGAGQIYNRKYWKLPIIYGGFVGCAYAMRWNNMMYRDYSQAYLDIMDDDPQTQSYNQFLHLGNQITPENTQRWQEIFRKRKDRYRRWRDMSFFCMLGVYALSVIDAYVDASLSEFDISPDLSLSVAPTISSQKTDLTGSRQTSVGVSCSLNF